ncbi:MAG: SpoIIIAH-like family protein [Hyphomonadaceae bacterium]|nr:SpoIIIAH-like family protein [Clostridia bacterium]
MMVVKRKQIVVVSMVLMIVIAGYLNWQYNNGMKDGADYAQTADNAKNYGEATLVNKQVQPTAAPAPSTKPQEVRTPYFSDAQKSKEKSRAESVAMLESVINNPNADAEGKQKAQSQMMQLAKNNDTEMVIQNLIKAKGLKDASVLLNDGRANVVVLCDKLSPQQAAQIQEIVIAQAKISTDKIKIIEVK